MTTFFTSDPHIGHRLVAKIRSGCPQDEVRERRHDDARVITAHDRRLAAEWDAVVSAGDTVWVFGDIHVGGPESAERALEWVSERPGHKRLVAGNHDLVHPRFPDAPEIFPLFAAVFEHVCTEAVIMIDGTRLLANHFPYDWDADPRSKFDEFKLRDVGTPLLHGHTHSVDRFSRSHRGTPQIHVGVDAWGMRPVPEDELAGLIETAFTHRDDRRTGSRDRRT